MPPSRLRLRTSLLTSNHNVPTSPHGESFRDAAWEFANDPVDQGTADGDASEADETNDRATHTNSDEEEEGSPAPKRARIRQNGAATDATPTDAANTASGRSLDQNQRKCDGHTKLYLDGYEYTRANATLVKISYRCSYYRSMSCRAKLEFYAAIMDYDYANSVPHTCTPPGRASLDDVVTARSMRVQMQREVDSMSIAGSLAPQQIWEAVSEKFYNDGVVYRGLSKSRVVKRVHRTRAMHFGSDMHGRVEVPPLSLVKNSSMIFFQFHHVWSNPKLKTENKLDRVIGWAHPSLISLLRYENISLFIDGTFRCVPAKFKQCVVVMVYDQGTKLYVPVFYVLTASKTFESYWNILQYVGDACGERINPKQVVCDFESALINTVSDWFPDAQIVGCFFHFKQACQRKMTKYRLGKLEIDIAMEKGVLDMLTVVNPAMIGVQGVAWVKAKIKARCEQESIVYSTAKWRLFWKYFARTWVRLLPPRFWNVHGIRRDVVARTNNRLERFNRKLNAAFGTPHPSLSRFVQTIEEISR